MKVEINGEVQEVHEGQTVAGLVRELGFDGRGVAVALDGEVVSRSEWDTVQIGEGGKVEIVRAVQGG